jgi:hypothetical protein
MGHGDKETELLLGFVETVLLPVSLLGSLKGQSPDTGPRYWKGGLACSGHPREVPPNT